jgi:hypothetical protein
LFWSFAKPREEEKITKEMASCHVSDLNTLSMDIKCHANYHIDNDNKEMHITHEFEWGFVKIRCPGFSWKPISSDIQNVGYANAVIGLYRHELCDGFYVVEGYTISRNGREPTRIEMIPVFRRQRQVMDVES